MKVSEFSGTREEWTKFLEQNRGGILASWEWAESKRSQGWKIRRFQVADGPDVRLLAPVLQKPLPAGFCFFYSPESPIVSKGDWNDRANQKAFETLNRFLNSDSKKEKAIFYKIDPHQSEEEFPLGWLTGLGFRDAVEDVQAPHVVHVDLTATEDEIMARMKQSGRRHIRQAAKRGVSVRVGTTVEDLETFYSLHQKMAHRQGVTYRQKQYFEAIHKHFMEDTDRACFVIGSVDGTPLAATLVTFMGDESIYLYGGTDVNEGNTYAMYLVQWKGMQEAKRRGCAFYNMTGIAPTEDPNDMWAGMRQFKLKFGGDIVHLVGARDYPFKPVKYQVFSQADRVRRKLAKRSGL